MNKFSFAGVEPVTSLYKAATGKECGFHCVELSLNNQVKESESMSEECTAREGLRMRNTRAGIILGA